MGWGYKIKSPPPVSLLQEETPNLGNDLLHVLAFWLLAFLGDTVAVRLISSS